MTLTEKVFILKSIKPFDRLSDSELILTANITRLKSYENGKNIYSSGSAMYNLFVIVDGEASMSSGEKVDGCFGLRALVHDEVVPHTLLASSEVKVLLISKAHLLTLLYECPALMVGFLSLEKGVQNETEVQ